MAGRKLPQLQAGLQGIEAVFTQMQSLWAAIIDPVVGREQNQSIILPGIVLAVGDNVIPHTLNRTLQGWNVIRINAAAALYDKQATNNSADRNLVLNSSAIATVSLEVF